jgi:hypothetical protein
MPPNLTADDVGALERRMAAATSVDSVSVDKDVLAALIEAWRCWQMVEAMPEFTSLLVRGIAKDAEPGWYAVRRDGRGFYGMTAVEALGAALGEKASDAE